MAAILPAAAFHYFLGLTPQFSYVLGIAVTVVVRVAVTVPAKAQKKQHYPSGVFGFAVVRGEHGPCGLYFRYDHEHQSERWEWASPKGEVLARNSLHEALMALRNHPDCTKLEDLSAGRHRYGFAVVDEEQWELWHDSGDEWTWYRTHTAARVFPMCEATPMLTRSSLHEALEAVRDYPGRGRALPLPGIT